VHRDYPGTVGHQLALTVRTMAAAPLGSVAMAGCTQVPVAPRTSAPPATTTTTAVAANPSAATNPASAAAAASAPAAGRPTAAPAPAVAPVAPRAAAPALDLTSLEQRLKDTKAIGVFTKLSLKNQVDDLLARLRQKYDLLLLKALSVLQDGDPALASAISASREAIWGILADPHKFSKL
jgi:hypothetical protein